MHYSNRKTNIPSTNSKSTKIWLYKRPHEGKLEVQSGLILKKNLQEYCLKIVHKILREKAYTSVSELSYEVGFDAPNNSSKVGAKRFGIHP